MSLDIQLGHNGTGKTEKIGTGWPAEQQVQCRWLSVVTWMCSAFTSPGVRIKSDRQAWFLITHICLSTTSKLHKYLNQSPSQPEGTPQRCLGITLHIHSSSLVSLLEDNVWGSETTIVQLIQTAFGSLSLYMWNYFKRWNLKSLTSFPRFYVSVILCHE